jgi:hypothetical protein
LYSTASMADTYTHTSLCKPVRSYTLFTLDTKAFLPEKYKHLIGNFFSVLIYYLIAERPGVLANRRADTGAVLRTQILSRNRQVLVVHRNPSSAVL